MVDVCQNSMGHSQGTITVLKWVRPSVSGRALLSSGLSSTTHVRPIVTNRVVWSVSVSHY